jgi:hypothetical protein
VFVIHRLTLRLCQQVAGADRGADLAPDCRIGAGPPFDFEGGGEEICRMAGLRHAHSLERTAFKTFVPDRFDEMSQ